MPPKKRKEKTVFKIPRFPRAKPARSAKKPEKVKTKKPPKPKAKPRPKRKPAALKYVPLEDVLNEYPEAGHKILIRLVDGKYWDGKAAGRPDLLRVLRSHNRARAKLLLDDLVRHHFFISRKAANGKELLSLNSKYQDEIYVVYYEHKQKTAAKRSP